MARVILVTGASAGIGRACADRLHGAGWSVVGASRRGTSPGGWTPAAMDVDRDDSVDHGVAAVVAAHGRLDAVVAAAGWGLAGPAEATTVGDAKAQFETNLWGAVRVVRAALPAMRRQGAGRIVLVSSIGGVVAIPFQAFYSAGKFALEGYAEALAYEVAPFGVAVTLVEPGNVRTDFTASRRVVATPSGAGGPYAAAADRALRVM
ncbi:MAG: SDR family NAD(P)-dependent oxidoreductase, partial [Acidimicrobiales bacterium]